MAGGSGRGGVAGRSPDPLPYDEKLSLKQVVEATFENYPQGSIIAALKDESQALTQRTESLIAGYPMIYLQYIDDRLSAIGA